MGEGDERDGGRHKELEEQEQRGENKDWEVGGRGDVEGREGGAKE